METPLSFRIVPMPWDREGPRHYLARLAFANRVSMSTLRKRKVSYHESIFGKYFKTYPPSLVEAIRSVQTNLVVHSGYWIRHHSRFCPECLRDDVPHHTLNWEIRFADACTKHRCWLLDHCSCGRMTETNEVVARRCTCGISLGSLTTVIAPDAVVHLCELLSDTAIRDPAYEVEISRQAKSLSELRFYDLQNLTRIFGLYADPNAGRCLTGQQRFERNDESWPIVSVAAEILYQWPNGFHKALRWLHTYNDDEESTHRYVAFFGRLYLQLFNTLKGYAYDFLRRPFEEYVVQHWPQIPRLGNRRSVADENSKWISVYEVEQRLRVTRNVLMRIIDSENLEVQIRVVKQSGALRMLIRRDSFETLATTIGRRCTLSAAANQLGIAERRLARIATRILPDVRRYLVEHTRMRWRVSVKDLEAILAAGDDVPFTERVESEQITLADALQYLNLSDDCLAHVLARAQSAKQCRPISRVTGVQGAAGWVFKRSYLKSVIAKLGGSADERIATSMTLPALAIHWNVKQQVIYGLLKAKAFDAFKVNYKTYRGYLVSSSAVERFENDFVMARALALEKRTSSRFIATELKTLGFSPAYGPDNGCRQLFYRRTAELTQAMNLIARSSPAPFEGNATLPRIREIGLLAPSHPIGAIHP